jgi:hypothetical protein
MEPGRVYAIASPSEFFVKTKALADLIGDQRKLYLEWTTFETFYQARGLYIIWTQPGSNTCSRDTVIKGGTSASCIDATV